jgi:hypothetical protein
LYGNGLFLKIKHSHFNVYRSYTYYGTIAITEVPEPKARFALYLGLFDTGAQRLVEWFSLLVVEWVEEINAMLIHLRKRTIF